jgi:tetratricopeptide (TPR) repeat protein
MMQPVGKKLRIFGLSVIGLLLAAGLGWGGYHFYRIEKRKKLVTNARAALSKSIDQEALYWVAQAYQQNPNGIEENRLMADLADMVKSPGVLELRKRVASLEPGNIQNYLAWANSALEMGELALAQSVLNEAPSNRDKNSDWHNLSAAVSAGLNQSFEAEKHFEAAAELDPGNTLKQVNLRTIRLISSDKTKSQEAREWLQKRADDPQVGGAARRALLQEALRRNSLSDADIVKPAIERDLNSAMGDRVNCLEVDYREGRYLDSLQRLEDWAKDRPNDANLLVYWMANHQLGQQALDWTKAAFPSPPVPLQIAIADAIAGRSEWALLQKTLADSDWKGLNFARKAMLIRAKREQGNQTWHADWRALLKDEVEKDRSPNRQIVLMLARLVQAWNWLDEARDLYWQLTDHATPNRPEVLDRLFQICRANRNTVEIFRVVKLQLDDAPDNIAFRNNYAFLAFLLKLDTDRAIKIAEENAKKYPNQNHIIGTLAMALLEQRKPTEARQVIEKINSDTLATPDVALVYARVLFANDDLDNARKFAKIGSTSANLLPEEESVAKRILGSGTQ